jgi:hypothetical protein
VGLSDEVLEHLFGHFEVRDDAVAHRADSDDIARRAPEHLLCVLADRLHVVRDFIDRHDGGFTEHHAAPFRVDEGVCGAEIDCQIVGTKAGKEREGHKYTSNLDLFDGRDASVQKIGAGKRRSETVSVNELTQTNSI